MVRNPRRPWYGSRPFLALLTALAVLLSVVAIVAERKQGFSFFWRAEGDTLYCTSAMPPHYSVVRQYTASKIQSINKGPWSQDPSVDVVVLMFSGLAYSIPTQSSLVINDFDGHIAGLQDFLARVHAGDDSATHASLHPVFVTMVTAAVLAVCTWILLFVLMWLTRHPPAAEVEDGIDAD